MIEVDNVNVYVITHGRAPRSSRPTCELLDYSGLKYYLVMNEKQVDAYLAEGVKRDQIIVSTDEFEKEYFERNKTYDVDFHGAICNRAMCNIHAKADGKKYAVQLDDNIIHLSIGKRPFRVGDKAYFCMDYIPNMIEHMRDICESTNIGFLGLGMGTATPTFESKILRVGYAYSFFMENVEANIPWRGPFDDDVLHNLDFNHSGKYTNALVTAYGYGKETKSKTGMRGAYNKYEAIRPIGTANIYPDHIGVGVAAKANGKDRRFYHIFRKAMHQNIKVTDKELFEATIKAINNDVRSWRAYSDRKRYYGKG